MRRRSGVARGGSHRDLHGRVKQHAHKKNDVVIAKVVDLL